MNKFMDNYYANKIKENKKYELAKKMFLDGKSLTEIDKAIDFNRHLLSTLLKYEGYVIKKNGQKHTYNEDYFKKIDTETKAYWLGFLYADGQISADSRYSLRLALSKKDYNHIVKLKNELCSDLSVVNYEAFETVTKKYHEASRITFTNKAIVESLLDLGCYPNKTQALEIPYDKIPNNLIRDFIRGFFDGDGSMFINSVGRVTCTFLSASEKIIQQIQDILVNVVGMKRNKLSKRIRPSATMPLYTFSNSSKEDIIKFGRYIYEGSTIFLERKHNKIEEILTQASQDNSLQKS